MPEVKCPSCGQTVSVPEKKSSLPWVIGCLVALVAIPVVLAVLGLMAAIAIPSFVKARQTSIGNACINNLRQIDAAKEQWGLSLQAVAGSTVDCVRVNEYIKGNTTPLCPGAGSYVYGVLGEDPECSVHGSLSDPRGASR